MKQCLKKIAEQPDSVFRLINDLVLRAATGRKYLSRCELSKAEQKWLTEHGFKWQYKPELYEYEIKLD